MNKLKTERRTFELRQDADGRVISGTVIKYGDRANIAGEFLETFNADSLALRDPVLNIQHDRGRLLAREGAGLSFTPSGSELQVRADLPNTRIADDAIEMVKAGLLRGLSMEFVVTRADWDDSGDLPIRTISGAELHGIGLVDKPAYPQSTLASEARSILDARVNRPDNGSCKMKRRYQL